MAKKFLTPIDLTQNEIRNAVFQNLASAPASPSNGQFYYDTTKQQFGVYENGTWWYSSTAVVSVAAGDTTITIGGTSTAPTVAVAKTLDHTYVTDFVSTVETVRLDQMAAPTAAVGMNGQKLTGLADASANTDAVNLETLLSYVSGLTSKDAVAYATAAALPANIYANGTNGVGATLTATANGVLSVDGAAVSTGQRILVKDEAAQANNGIYTVTNTGSGSAAYVLTRATDANTGSDLGPGLLVPVEAPSGGTAGAVNNGKVFISAAPNPFTVGTSAITFSQVGATYTAGTGLTLSGTQFSLTIPVTVADGGTGATTAAGARTNLGATTKYAQSIGDGSSTSITVTHNLGTQDVVVSVFDSSTFAEVGCDVTHTTTNTITVGFTTAPATNAYRVVVVG